MFSMHTGHLTACTGSVSFIDSDNSGTSVYRGAEECCRLRRFDELDSGEHKSTTAVILCAGI